eukprot:9641443-Lingulodinium_polyedra.AAC.1
MPPASSTAIRSALAPGPLNARAASVLPLAKLRVSAWASNAPWTVMATAVTLRSSRPGCLSVAVKTASST